MYTVLLQKKILLLTVTHKFINDNYSRALFVARFVPLQGDGITDFSVQTNASKDRNFCVPA
jgi:hypothetical protein